MNKLGIFAAPEFAISYAAAALFLAGCHFYNQRFPSAAQNSEIHLTRVIACKRKLRSNETTFCSGVLPTPTDDQVQN